jgi:NADPH-dependent ferric siderophore reductase
VWRSALSRYVYRVLEVVRTELVTPALRRIVLGGPDLAGFGTSRAGPSIKIYFPRQGQRRPLMPEPDGQGGLWWPPDDLRPIMRTYSVRRFEPDLGVAGGW